jgi:sorting nexin-1/2
MDGFDDLLDPSRHVLEENPFQDPFAKRSNSPDPWSTPFAASQSSHDQYRSEIDQERTTTPTTESYGTVDRDDPSINNSQNSQLIDPLDSAARAADDDDDDDVPLGRSVSPRSPGFKESIPAFSEIATIRPTEPEELEPSVPAPAESHRPHTPTGRIAAHAPASPPPSSLHTKKISYSGPSGSGPPSPSTSKTQWERSAVVSPLEQPAPASLDRSFTGLALGGEAVGGWSGDQDSWSNERSYTRFPTEDDSDDDKPILQSVKHSDHEDSTQVSIIVQYTRAVSLILFDRTKQKYLFPHGKPMVFNLFLQSPSTTLKE